jgi:hypothetical protein
MWASAIQSSDRFTSLDPLLDRIRAIRLGAELAVPEHRRRKVAARDCRCRVCVELRERRRLQRRRYRATVRFIKICEGCGNRFGTWRDAQRYCNRPCWLRELGKRRRDGASNLGGDLGSTSPGDEVPI